MKKTHQEVVEILLKIIGSLDGIKNSSGFPITLDSNLINLDLDSLDKIDIIMQCERNFDININDTDAVTILSKIVTINDLKNILRDKYKIFDLKKERKDKIIKINKLN